MHNDIMPYRPIYLWEITVNRLFTAVNSSWDSSPCRPTVAGPTGRQGPSGRSPAVGTYEGWVTSYGVCGHLLDSLSVWGHSATLSKPEQAHFGRFYGIMFFRQDSLKSEGRNDADPGIKTRPERRGAVRGPRLCTLDPCAREMWAVARRGVGPFVKL